VIHLFDEAFTHFHKITLNDVGLGLVDYVSDIEPNNLRSPESLTEYFSNDLRTFIAETYSEELCNLLDEHVNAIKTNEYRIYTNYGVRDSVDWWLLQESMKNRITLEEYKSRIRKISGYSEWYRSSKELAYTNPGKNLKDLGIFPFKAPQMVLNFEFEPETILGSLEKYDSWSSKVEAYRLYLRGVIQDDIGLLMGVDQSTISKWVSSVKGEVSRLMGEYYEKYLVSELSKNSKILKITHNGEKGEADLILELKDGTFQVISAKCYDSKRKTVSIPIDEINPEIRYAEELLEQGKKVKLFVDYYNYNSKTHKFRELDLEDLPSRILFEHI